MATAKLIAASQANACLRTRIIDRSLHLIRGRLSYDQLHRALGCRGMRVRRSRRRLHVATDSSSVVGLSARCVRSRAQRVDSLVECARAAADGAVVERAELLADRRRVILLGAS